MNHVGHFIAGTVVGASASDLPILNPATGRELGRVAVGTSENVDAAVAAAMAALPQWSATGLQFRANLMLNLRAAIKDARSELIDIVVAELGKTQADAAAEVDRGIEMLGQAASVGNWYGAPATPGVSSGVDVQEYRFPIGVVAAISPFNFPVLIPILQSAMAIVCGNTVVMKPSERDPSACLRIAELFQRAGLPDGVFNVVMGDRLVVDRLLEHPDVAGISFVGSTPVARHIRITGVANNKRVQAFGGGKNHMVVMPDADLDAVADAAVSSAYGAAGQRCMAVSVVVAVGDSGDSLVQKIADRLTKLKVGSPAEEATQIGPVITKASHASITSHLANAENEGAKLVVDGRNVRADDGGWYVGPSLIDHVKPGMAVHATELFGPVLSVVRVPTYDEAAKVIASHPLGNGAAIFTRDGATARRFINETESGMIGINVPIPFPALFHSFGGWKDSSFAETKLFGPGALNFCTRTKTVSVRWPESSASSTGLGSPSSR
jgi:malonate-semialdehyde dehydrogenase (acetylating)/methylmalonate-semialdehyde dehydrogenase